jgi:hypothetical protein
MREMRTIILTYPDFQSLPRGIKQMLLATESFYFGETEVHAAKPHHPMPKADHPVSYPFATPPVQPREMRAAA